jgi:hypothetical protein
MKEVNGLQIDQDVEHYRRSHKRKVAVLWLFLVFILAVLAGATGKGPVSDEELRNDATGEKIETQRFIRYQSPIALTILANTSIAGNDSLFDIAISTSYLQQFSIESILPEPVTTAAGGDNYVFSFKVIKGQRGQPIIFHIKPEQAMKNVKGEVMLEDGATFTISQYIYP